MKRAKNIPENTRRAPLTKKKKFEINKEKATHTQKKG